MPRLKSANFAVTELASGITNAATSFQVVDASLFPNEGPFIVLVHDSTPGFAGVREIMEVGSINKGTNTFSDVLRGREGTSPVAHSAGARAECIWTAGTHGELADKVDLDAHLADGTQHAKVARFIIGTSTAGWTSANCDYLCDGTADDVEINAAITALPATGGEIVILDGTYNITASINIPKDNVSIRGSGNTTTLKRMYNSTNTDSGPTAKGLITLNGKSGCKIQGLQIDGTKATYTASYNYGICLYSSSDNTVTSNTCTNNSSSGIYLYSSSSDNTVTGNTCNNNYYGIYLSSSCSDNTVTDNTCNNGNFGIYLYSSSSNNTITGNTCNSNNYYGISLYSSSNNTVTGNTCNNNNSYGIRLSSSSNNTVTGNTCNNNSNYGIRLASSCSDNTVTGNTCNNNDYYGIYLSTSSNNTVTGNTCIRGTGTPEDYTTDQHTIYLSGTSNNYNLISSNNCMGKAVVISGGTGNSAWGNKHDSGNDLP